MHQNSCDQPLNELLQRMESEEFTAADLEQMCRTYPHCAADLKECYQLWADLEHVEVPEPSLAMHQGFDQILSDFSAGRNRGWTWGWLRWPAGLNMVATGWRPALVSTIFILGLAAGYLLRPTGQKEEEVAVAKNYVDLIDQRSTAQRLQVIYSAKEVDNPDARIIDALNQALLNDPNVNVRLSAIETMLHFAHVPKVRENLIRAIPHQTSPLVQVTLADAMILLEDERSVQELQKLLESDDVEVEVRLQLEKTLEVLL